MKAVDFDYRRAATVHEACQLLADANGEGKIIAGGQTLVPLLVMRLARPALLIDINPIEALQGVETANDWLAIRACTRQADALASALVRQNAPLLGKALRFVGHPQTRNRGTIGGSLANADPAAEIGLVAVTLGCEVVAQSAAAKRTISIGSFFTGPLTTALQPDECVTVVRFPIRSPTERVGAGFQEVSIRRSDFALVAAAAELVLDTEGVCRRASIGIGGAGPVPLRIVPAGERLVGTRLEDGDVADAAAIVRARIEPQADLHASADYRRRVAGELARRAIAEARQEALAGRI